MIRIFFLLSRVAIFNSARPAFKPNSIPPGLSPAWALCSFFRNWSGSGLRGHEPRLNPVGLLCVAIAKIYIKGANQAASDTESIPASRRRRRSNSGKKKCGFREAEYAPPPSGSGDGVAAHPSLAAPTARRGRAAENYRSILTASLLLGRVREMLRWRIPHPRTTLITVP